MRRIAIVLDKNLAVGASSNVAALLMGQAVLVDPALYHDAPLLDQDRIQHCGIKFSTVLLKAGPGQLLQLARSIAAGPPELRSVVFSRVGQGLNNAFDQYSAAITAQHTEETGVVGVIIWGDDEAVRNATRKYSVL